MRIFISVAFSIFSFLGLSLSLWQEPAFAGKVSLEKVLRKDVARLEKGEILVETEKTAGQEVPRVRLRAIVNAPPEKLWSIIKDCSSYQKTMNRIAESRELSHVGNIVVCEITADLPFPISNLTSTTRAEHTVTQNQYYKREWKLISGDYHFNEGKWELFAWGEHGEKTVVLYELFAVPKMSLPDFVLEAVTVRALPKTIISLRKQLHAPQ